MFDCVLAEPGNVMIVGDMTCMRIECFDKLEFYTTEDVDTTLHDVAYIPDVGLKLFSVHTAMRGEVVMGDRTGMYVMGGRLFFHGKSQAVPLQLPGLLPCRPWSLL